MSIGPFGFDESCLFVGAGSFGEAALIEEGFSVIVPGFEILRSKFQDHFIGQQRFAQPSEIIERIRFGVPEFGILVIDRKRSIVILQRLARMIEGIVARSPSEIGFGMLGVVFDRLRKTADSVAETLKFFIGIGQIMP